MRALVLILALSLAGCSGVTGAAVKSVAGAALGVDGGPSLSADVQAGKNNSRSTVGDSRVVDVRVAPIVRDNAMETLNQDNRTSTSDSDVGAENVGVINNNQVPTWLIILFALALPAIWEWPRLISSAIRRTRA